jgi:hypothetical protein
MCPIAHILFRNASDSTALFSAALSTLRFRDDLWSAPVRMQPLRQHQDAGNRAGSERSESHFTPAQQALVPQGVYATCAATSNRGMVVSKGLIDTGRRMC